MMSEMTRRLALLVLICLAVTASAFAPAPVGKAPNRLEGRFVTLKTSLGTIVIELFEDKAPISVKNFLAYVDDKHYDGTVFHRVITGYMIQGGGYEKGFSKITTDQEIIAKEKKTKPPIKNESSNGLSNKRGTIATARTAEDDSASAQFFINVKDNDRLDRANAPDKIGECVFGRVVTGMDVVAKINEVHTKRIASFSDIPEEDVVIESVRRGK